MGFFCISVSLQRKYNFFKGSAVEIFYDQNWGLDILDYWKKLVLALGYVISTVAKIRIVTCKLVCIALTEQYKILKKKGKKN